MLRERDWAKLRTQGQRRFIWLSGVVIWGIGTALTWATLITWWENRFVWTRFPWERWGQLVVPALVLFPLGGYWWGRWMWKTIDRRRGTRERRGFSRGPDRRRHRR